MANIEDISGVYGGVNVGNNTQPIEEKSGVYNTTNFNNELNAPDDMLKDVMSGNTNIDIHDVMIAMSKSEITVNVATQAVGKVIQAYDKIMQIQV